MKPTHKEYEQRRQELLNLLYTMVDELEHNPTLPEEGTGIALRHAGEHRIPDADGARRSSQSLGGARHRETPGMAERALGAVETLNKRGRGSVSLCLFTG